MAQEHTGSPAGSAYEWLQRGLALLARGDAAAAATLLQRADHAEPGQASVLEALGRAQYDAGRPGDAVRTFSALVDRSPDADYARFALGLALTRTGRVAEAVEHLALAAAMRPQNTEYTDRLRQARATLAARRAAAADPAGGGPDAGCDNGGLDDGGLDDGGPGGGPGDGGPGGGGPGGDRRSVDGGPGAGGAR